MAQSKTLTALQDLVEDLPDQFGGAYHHPDDGHVVLAAVAQHPVSLVSAALLERIRKEVPTAFEEVRCDRSWRQLRDLEAVVADLSRRKAAPAAITGYGIRVEYNVLNVSVESLSPEVRQFFQARFGEAVRLEESGFAHYAYEALNRKV